MLRIAGATIMKRLRPDHETSNTYSTTITKSLHPKMEKVGKSIDKIIALNGTDTEALDVTDNIIAIKGELHDVPAFAHPFYHDEHVIIDARAFVNKEGNIKDLAEYHLLQKRAKAELAWIEDTHEFGSQMDFVTDVFASWFSNGITKRLNMTMAENQQLRILAAVYYLHFLHRSEGTDAIEANLILLRILPKILRVPATMVEEVLGAVGETEIGELYSYEGEETPSSTNYLDALLRAFNNMTDDAHKLTQAVVMQSLTRGAFVAANSPEITSIAIEHPPTFYVMIYFALQKGVHGRTTLGVTTASVARRHNEEKFEKFMNTVFQ